MTKDVELETSQDYVDSITKRINKQNDGVKLNLMREMMLQDKNRDDFEKQIEQIDKKLDQRNIFARVRDFIKEYAIEAGLIEEPKMKDTHDKLMKYSTIKDIEIEAGKASARKNIEKAESAGRNDIEQDLAKSYDQMKAEMEKSKHESFERQKTREEKEINTLVEDTAQLAEESKHKPFAKSESRFSKMKQSITRSVSELGKSLTESGVKKAQGKKVESSQVPAQSALEKKQKSGGKGQGR